MTTALIIDDHEQSVADARSVFEAAGFDVVHIADADSARDALIKEKPELALVNVELVSEGEGRVDLSLLENVDLPEVSEVYLLSSNPRLDIALQGMRLGATDYFQRPMDLARLEANVRSLRDELNCDPGPETEDPALDQPPAIVGSSAAINRLRRMMRKVANTDASVLLLGESGTGKELAAQYIHAISHRSQCPFVAVNCSAITAELAESHFFGHRKGAFTGANEDREGVFSEASGGTLFLDEITEMNTELQAKLLRVLETSQYRAVGDEKDRRTDVRVIASSNREPAEAVDQGYLRKDLYFRLSEFPITLPPLRERGEDVVRLARYFLELLTSEYGADKSLSDEALQWIRLHDWPGNARELRNVITQAYIMAGERIEVDDLPQPVIANGSGENDAQSDGQQASEGTVSLKVGESIEDAEKKLILATLERSDGNKSKAAETLGISPKTLYNKLKKYQQPE